MSERGDRLAGISAEKRALLALRLQQRARESRREEVAGGLGASGAIPRGPEEGDAPLSYAQERFWFLHRLEPSAVYNDRLACRLAGPLDRQALIDSLGEIARRHAILRTTIAEILGRPVQRVGPPPPLPLLAIDLRRLPGSVRAEECSRAVEAATGVVFTLDREPAFRLALLDLGREEHVLAVTLHHVLTDGWSWRIFLRELAALYGARTAGHPSPLPALPIQYADFARWQRARLAGGEEANQHFGQHLEYWRRQLAGLPPVLALPLDRPRPARQTFNGAARPFVPSPALTAALRDLARRHGATLFMTLLATFQALLGRWTGQMDVAAGTLILGRDRPETEPLIGVFINTLVLRARLAGDPTFTAFLAAVRQTATEAYGHQELPFEKLVEALDPERDPSHSPLVQVAFGLQTATAAVGRVADLHITPLTLAQRTTRFELVLDLEEAPGGGLEGALQYNSDLFDATTIARLAGHLRTLAEAAVSAGPDRRLSELPWLAAGERQQVLVEWNARASGAPVRAPEGGFQRAIAAQAARAPEAIAVATREGMLTYGELLRRAGRLAGRLRSLGVGPESVVGVALPRSPLLPIALLGILEAGGAYLPLDPHHPAERLAMILADSGAQLCLHAGGAPEEWSHQGPPRLDLGAPAGRLDLPVPPAAAPLAGENLAYVIYTSGSTGRPKGVEIAHRGVASFLAAMGNALALAAGDVLLALTTVAFDIAVLELFLPWTVGARVELVDRETAIDGRRLGDAIAAAAPTVVQATPATWQLLLDAGWQPGREVKLLCGGEALARPLADRLTATGATVWNLYGPTEATVWASAQRVPAAGARVSLGRPLAGLGLFVLDDGLRPVAVGVRGEIYLAGLGLARGYRGRPELTAERFVPHPASASPGERLYRTGDQGRFLADGEVEFLGRDDHQVKLRGFRIELGEIEHALLGHPSVTQAVVVVAPVPSPRLVAYLVVADEAEAAPAGPVPAKLRSFLSGRLPDYMVPGTFVLLPRLPLSPSGKVDRRALPAPETAAPRSAVPRTAAEELLGGIWSRVLGIDAVSAEDDFFALGGHSLLATRVLARLLAELGVDLPLGHFFAHPTLGAQARLVEAALGGGSPLAGPPLVRVSREGDLALSFTQQRLWLLQQLDPLATSYSLPVALRLRGAIAIAGVAHALGEVVRRHEALRTTFELRDGAARQRIGPWAGGAPLSVIDLGSLPAAAVEAAGRRALTAALARPFDLSRGPLLLGYLLRHGERDHVLLVNQHHIVSDGASVEVLLREAAALYAAFTRGQPSTLPEPPIQFADWADWQRRCLSPEAVGRQLAHWRRLLAGIPFTLELPADRPRPAAITLRGAVHRFALPPTTAEGLAALARSQSATRFMVGLACFEALLHRVTGMADFVVGTPVGGRTRVETEGLIGPLLNVLALPASCALDLPFEGLLDRARTVILEAYPHQDLPFERLVAELKPERSLNRAPLVQVLFGLLQRGDRAVPLPPGLTLEVLRTDPTAVQFDLNLALAEQPDGGLAGSLQYAADLFDRTTVARLEGHFRTLVAAVAAAPSRRLSELPTLAAAEHHQVVLEWNDTVGEAAPENGFHAAIGSRAAAAPEAVAVTASGAHLSYRELARRAGRLAARLRLRGVGPEARVAVALPRSLDLVVGLLGILEAGGAYLPLDASHPAERLEWILADSGARLCVVRGGLPGGLRGAGLGAVDLDGAMEDTAAAAGARRVPAARPGGESLAYVMYTSGSTGRPKGVEIPHRAVANFLSAVRRELRPAASDVLLAVTTVAFDISVLELFLPLLVGARVELVGREAAMDGLALSAAIGAFSPTFLQATPATWQLLFDAGWQGQPGLNILCGGEALPRPLADRLAARGTAVWNLYGPTEATVWASVHRLRPGGVRVPIGRPIEALALRLLDGRQKPVPVGGAGEIYLGGAGIARGYGGRPELTAERFVPDPWSAENGGRLYRTGDLGRYRVDGEVEFLGRNDHQVKLRGFRIELGEIEHALLAHRRVSQAVVVATAEAIPRLVAYLVALPMAGEEPLAAAEIRRFLAERLPEYMVPSAYVHLAELPLSPSGKLDRRALPAPSGDRLERAAADYQDPETQVEQQVAAAWKRALELDRVGRHDNFFDLGGTSMLALSVHRDLERSLGVAVSLVDLFEHSTIARLAAALAARGAGAAGMERAAVRPASAVVAESAGTAAGEDGAVAVIGMVCRLPGAANVDEYWRNLLDGVESITFYSRAELLAAGVPAARVDDPRRIAARGRLAGIEEVDAAFFGLTPREAELLDPQHRIFLECAWEALEQAGYGGAESGSRVGLFAGMSFNGYLLANILPQRDLLGEEAGWQVLLGNDKDYLTTRTSYLLGLTGPSVLVQAACSTSLVAIHLAREAILRGECEMALAGGISVRVPQVSAQLYQEGGITSPDGHCRAFDAAAQGTVWGDGVGLVVLKRLAAARADGDRIVAVLKGSAINNDGDRKVGFTAPSVEGQTAVIRAALQAAGVAGGSIGYVEGHGTGTPLGDPIEIRALAQALGGGRSRPCWIGSVKSNIGHLDTAAGVAGFIKAALAVDTGELPASLHFVQPNPRIDWSAVPFEVVARRRRWEEEGPRRAGVSAFGIGGTNAHAVLEEAPPRVAPGPSRPCQLLIWSAKSAAALRTMTEGLGAHLAAHPELTLADVAYTLARGRRRMAHRRAWVGAEAAALSAGSGWEESVAAAGESPPQVVFLFPGQGAVHPGMGEGLYRQEAVFRRAVERCSAILEPLRDESLVRRLYGAPEERWTADELAATQCAQPALFAVSYALAELWRSWGLEPWAMLGHSLGEYVAATLAGVLELADALRLVEARATLMGRLPRGAMLSVELPAVEAAAFESAEVELAAENAPRLSVLSGTTEGVARVGAVLAAQGVSCRPLATSHAFHSAMMEPILEPFGAALARVKLSPPRRPYLSCLTGTWICAEEATDARYWVRHLRERVRFSAALGALFCGGRVACVELGPGRTLASLARNHPAKTADSAVFGSLPPVGAAEQDGAHVLRSLGRYWLAGGEVDWAGYFAGEARRREPLPTYPFERRRYWLGGLEGLEAAAAPVLEGGPRREEQTPATGPTAPVARNRPSLPTPYAAATTDSERTLVEIWQSLFHIVPIGVDDDFFELGGHSLLGTQLMSRIHSVCGRQLPLSLLFAAPTVARLAAHLTPAADTAPCEEKPPLLVAQARPEVLPLSFAQQRLWFLAQLDPGNPAYNLAFAVRALGDLSPDLLAHAFAEICRRHEALRTGFAVDRGRPAQRIAAAANHRLETVDLRGLPTERLVTETHRLAIAEARRPFDLARGPLLRTLLLRLGAREQVVVTTVHHIVADGWSLGLLLAELEVHYRAAAQGRPSPLPALAVQYADFALWQRHWLAGDNLARRLAYWRRQLGGELAGLEIPTDRPRPAVPSFAGGDLRFALPLPLSAAVAASSRRHGATLFMTLLAAFQALLHRHSGQTDIVVGSPVANRDQLAIEPLIGCFVNTLVLRGDLADDPSFAAVESRAREVALGAQAHQDVPFELLVQELKPDRDLSRTPLFQVLFTLQNAPFRPLDLPGVRLVPESLAAGTAAYDLALSLAEGEEGLRGILTYRTDLFDQPTARRLLDHFERLLAAAVESPACPVSLLPLLSSAERHQLLAEWQDPPLGRDRLAPHGASLHGLCAVAAVARPAAVAVAGGDRQLSYGELERRANRLAHHLRQLGAGPGSVVGICLARSPDLVVALLAVLKSGAAYLPLDPAYPEERLAFMIEDSGARLAICEGSWLTGLVARRVDLNGEAAAIARQPSAGPPAGLEIHGSVASLPTSLAYLIYTSGSTGRPKGVEVPHTTVVRFLAAMAETPGLTACDTLAAVTTLSFDIAVLEIFLPLAVGARVVLVEREEVVDPRALARRLALCGATAMQATPATWQSLVDGGWNNPGGLRVLCGGEAFPRALADALLACAPEVWNLYGPTEATVWSAVWRVSPGDGPLPVGRPIAGTRLLVLGEGGPVPVGVAGEIHIAGEGVARGYHGSAGLTAAVFVPDSTSAVPGARLYRTGDLGRVLADGRLQVLGRRDHQVKVRGFRIEPGEIEAALAAHPGVGQAVVVARAVQAGDRQLVAYVVAAGLPEPTGEELRRFLAATLPAHLLPTAWIFLAELPRTPNGKVDRRALPAPTGERLASAATYVAPRDPLEEAVAAIWREVLGVERIGVYDSFFALGGHSLLATQVTSRLFESLQVDLPLRHLFVPGTVAGLASAILAEQLRHLSAAEQDLLAQADQMSEEQLEAELLQLKEQERG